MIHTYIILKGKTYEDTHSEKRMCFVIVNVYSVYICI